MKSWCVTVFLCPFSNDPRLCKQDSSVSPLSSTQESLSSVQSTVQQDVSPDVSFIQSASCTGKPLWHLSCLKSLELIFYLNIKLVYTLNSFYYLLKSIYYLLIHDQAVNPATLSSLFPFRRRRLVIGYTRSSHRGEVVWSIFGILWPFECEQCISKPCSGKFIRIPGIPRFWILI